MGDPQLCVIGQALGGWCVPLQRIVGQHYNAVAVQCAFEVEDDDQDSYADLTAAWREYLAPGNRFVWEAGDFKPA